MSMSITQRVLGSNRIYTDNYLRDVMLLTKSITVYCKDEVELYNKVVEEHYKRTVDRNDPTTWRYYRHLAGKYHEVDTPIILTSLDSGVTIELTKEAMQLHRTTRAELLKYDYQYTQLVNKYPDQELYIKTVLNSSPVKPIADIIAMEPWTIVSYNADLIEEQETSLIYELQRRLDNYKVHRLHTTYGLMESYYLAGLFTVLYHFLLTTIIAIRLEADKTDSAHSYHVLNYLSSYHELDQYHRYLTRKQAMFLYRNLLYLNNHSGSNNVFDLLIDRLFTEKRVTVVGYEQRQRNSVDERGMMEYRYSQSLKNKTDLVYSTRDFSLEDMSDKERGLYAGNEREYTFNNEDIDFTNRIGLRSEVTTKDLEINLVDNSNDVPRRLIEVLIDYWAYSMSLGRMNFLVTVIDPVSNKEYKLSTADMFKLFIATVHLRTGRVFERFETYTAHNVFMPSVPSQETLESALYRKEWTITNMIRELRESIPSYPTIDTAYAFNLFSGEVYEAHLNQWLTLTSQSDKNIHAQYDMAIGNVTWTGEYHFDGETLDDFLTRIAFTELYEYSPETHYELGVSILNAVSYDKLGELQRNRHIQEALVGIFKQFNSYTTQLIDKYFSDEAILCNLKAPLYAIDKELQDEETLVNIGRVTIDATTSHVSVHEQEEVVTVELTGGPTDLFEIDVGDTPPSDSVIYVDLTVNMPPPVVLDLVNDEPEVEIDQDLLIFLATNQ